MVLWLPVLVIVGLEAASSLQVLESEAHTDLSGKGNADGRAGAKEIAKPTGGNRQLAQPHDRRRGSARRIRANIRNVAGGRLCRRNRQRRNVGHKVRARIVAIEEIEEFDERRNVPVLVKSERTAHAQVSLNVRRSAKFVERSGRAVHRNARAVIRGGDDKRPRTLRLN